MASQMDRLSTRQHTLRDLSVYKIVSISQTEVRGMNAMYSDSSLELVVWNSDVGFAIGSLYELIDGHDLTLRAIEEASTEVVAPRCCSIGAICAVVITRVGARLQIKDVHLKARCLSSR